MNSSRAQDLSAHYSIDDTAVQFFKKHGYIKLKNVLHPDTIHFYNQLISSEVNRLNTQHLPMEQRDTYAKAFLQIMNIWVQSSGVKEFVFSKKLAGIAADLLETDGVRLYHDQALYKEPGGGQTPWHADQYYWPLETDRSVTVWIPLQATPLEMGPLEFSAGSFNLSTGRNKKISDESQELLKSTLKSEGYPHIIESFDIGEVSYHMGWLFHRAGPNKTNSMRSVMTMIYIDKEMRLKTPENENQQADWDTWCPGAVPGEIIDSPINPVLFER
ncbi:MAG: phytanoyl-CoA dioxygenase family protein [Saprospiraceae bacterium]